MGAYTEEELARMDDVERRVLSALKTKDEPFDVPMVNPSEDEFAFLKNAERKALIEEGAYDAIRIILEEERISQEEYERELTAEAAAES